MLALAAQLLGSADRARPVSVEFCEAGDGRLEIYAGEWVQGAPHGYGELSAQRPASAPRPKLPALAPPPCAPCLSVD